MDLSLGMLSTIGNGASAAERLVRHGQSPGSETPRSGGDYAESAATPATRESTTQRPVRESAENSRLTDEEKAEVRELQKRDREVRAHEAAHRAAAGGLASGGSYTYKRGPDGRTYAVAGEVSIRMPSTGDAKVRLRQAETVRRAALAPADPSPQDRQVAAQAAAMAAQARSDIQAEQRAQLQENREKATDQGSDGRSAVADSALSGQRAIASFQAIGGLGKLHSAPSTIDEMI
ncbi:MAG: putative metalloprotease CJM1_0395 family protein [Candidatus Thiodiazotropha sp.]